VVYIVNLWYLNSPIEKGVRMVDQDALTKKFQKEMNAGTSSLVLLSVMRQAEEPMYGYQVAKLLEDHSQDTPLMKQSALYPVLRSLEGNGLLESNVEPSVSGPPRRYYHITEAGRQTLQIWEQLWDQTKSFVDTILKGVSHD
jgi:PadR family transcriptional regulator PadR